MTKRRPTPRSARRLALERLMRETLELLRPTEPHPLARKPRKRTAATPRR